MSRGELAGGEVRVRLSAIVAGVQAAVGRRGERTATMSRPELHHLAVTEQHAQVMLEQALAYAARGRAYGPGAALTRDHIALLGDLEANAHAAGVRLPSRALRGRGLSDVDLEVLLLACAPWLEPAFGGLYAFLNDERAATAATPHVAVEVLASDADHERRVTEACGPFGTLRSEGLLYTGPERAGLTVLLPADGIVELLQGADIEVDLLGHGARRVRAGALPAGIDAGLVEALADGLHQGTLDTVGVWGRPGAGGDAVVAALIRGAACVRVGVTGVETALQRAALLNAVCVIDVPAEPESGAEVARAVTASAVRVILVAAEPLRDSELLRRRRFGELRLAEHGFADRRASWAAAFPDLDGHGLDDLAARFRLQPADIEAVASMERTSRSWARNGSRPRLDDLATLVSRRRSPSVAAIRTPGRGPDMLVLPDQERRQIMEIAAAARVWPRVAEDWQLERFGNPGVTALFAGDPGTGKTLAAEVIAAEVGIDLMVVDLSRLVSKWIGETEKNLDAVFDEAEASNCVLFFDEADSIFGQRGEVTRGADRYANLEVGYLLQRLESYEGLVILASNMRANLDAAFTRRFHHVVHFPSPGEPERERLWELSLGPPVQLAEELDIGLLTGLELSGAGIAAIVRSAALAVFADGRDALTARDVVQATQRQFQREGRLLPHQLLGPYAGLLAT